MREQDSVDAFELFIQWLYTRKYEEENARVSEFKPCAASGSNLSLSKRTEASGPMDWGLKAAVLAWDLGRYLEAEDF